MCGGMGDPRVAGACVKYDRQGLLWSANPYVDGEEGVIVVALRLELA